MEPIVATKLLFLSGCLAVFSSSWLGVVMFLPLQRPQKATGKGVNFKQIGAAHVDWILLGLMSAAAGGLTFLFELRLTPFIIWAMIFGAWANPLPYVWRAFGINAFVFSGGPVQRIAAMFGGASSIAILTAWGAIFYAIVTGSVGVFS